MIDVERLVRAMDAADDEMTRRGYTLASFANKTYAPVVAFEYASRSDFSCVGCGNATHIDIDHPVNEDNDRPCVRCTCQKYVQWSDDVHPYTA